MIKTLSVAAIKNGTVIDHIPAGQALRIIRLLNLITSKHKITLGLNLPSKSMGHKDVLKIEARILSEAEASDVIVFAPKATINLIENFEVTKKISPRLPEAIKNVFICPNAICITHTEPVASFFYIDEQNKRIKLTCKYCEKRFDRDQVKDIAL